MSSMGLAERLERVKERIDQAARVSGRTGSDITLIAVSKTFPEEDILRMSDLGQVHFGENKAQEFTAKRDALSERALRWHFIGHLQRNKVKEVIDGMHLFHALDSERLGREFQRRLEASNTSVDCLVQVNVSGEDSKFGVSPEMVEALLDKLRAFDRIRLNGFMTLAAPTDDPEDVRSQFVLLRELAESHAHLLHADVPVLSMGMSGDYRVAIEEGATHVRVGSALFGSRD